MSTIKLFDNYPKNKFDQQMLANDIILPVIEGEVNPIETYIKARSMQEALKIVTDDDRIKDLVITEVEKYGNKAEFNSANLQVKDVGVKYDYSVCNDQIYTDLLYMLNDIKEQIKIREKFLSKIPSEGATIVYEQTGEVRTIYPPIKQGSQGITITFKK